MYIFRIFSKILNIQVPIIDGHQPHIYEAMIAPFGMDSLFIYISIVVWKSSREPLIQWFL